MSCLLAAGTRLAAIREWELLRNLVPPSPGGCFSTSLGFDVGCCCTPPSPTMGLQAPMGSFIQQFQEAAGREQPIKQPSCFMKGVWSKGRRHRVHVTIGRGCGSLTEVEAPRHTAVGLDSLK